MEDIKFWKAEDTIAANKELEKYLKGRPKYVSELKNESLLIEVISKEQANKILHIKRLNNVKVMVQIYSALNYTKRKIRSRRYIDTEDDILLEEMKEDKVIDS